MVRYVEHLPLLSRENVGSAPPSLACFTQLATLLTLLQRRFKLEPDVPLQLRELVAPLRAAARAVNLSHAQEELIEGVLGALSALVPPELAGAMPAADAASSSRLDEAEYPSLSKHGPPSSPEVHQGTLPRGTPRCQACCRAHSRRPCAPNAAAGWMAKIELSDNSELDSLMDAAAYAKFCAA
jgi:hypothetical protein